MPASVPVPSGTWATVQRVPEGDRHPGLVLDKLIEAGEEREGQQTQRRVLETVCKAAGDAKLLAAVLQRRNAELKAVGASVWTAKSTGPLTLHLARASALENAGICLHPLYGFTYLPGTGLKGLARAYAETVWVPAQKDPAAAWRRVERIFGWAPHSDDHKRWKPKAAVDPAEDAASGSIVFHDGWPTTWPIPRVDITNSHHPHYYQEEKVQGPGDWDKPIPVYFLSLRPRQEFSFAVAKRRTDVPDDDLAQARDWLVTAMAAMGVGAKTASGYGAVQPAEGSPAAIPGTSFEATVELVSPAFLAGALQRPDDCELRPATLRGLLRWWWRTLHAGYVDVPTLRKLEGAVWGDTNAGGALRVTVEALEVDAPSPYDEQALFQRLPPRDGKKTCQGLGYHAYGMSGGKDRPKRHYVHPGARWRVAMHARKAYYPPDTKDPARAISIPPDGLLQQGRASLWLLCNHGGVGAKNRKGFGSLQSRDLAFDFKACQAAAAGLRNLCEAGGTFDEKNVDSPSL